MLKHAHMIGPRHPFRLTTAFSLAVLGAVLLLGQTVQAQASTAPVTEERVPLTRAELEELVGPIALYPDDLVSIVLPASTYPLQIVQAARYLEEHKTNPELKPDEDWDDSVVALLNYPEVIELMNADLDWTWKLGEAALYQQTELLDAIQEFRDRAHAAGNLRSDERQVVTKNGETIVIEPVDPKVIYVPYYEPEYVVVHHSYPVYHYYPRAYPVYYYPYPYGYSFGFSYWGVTLAFSIDWHSHHVRVHHRHHRAHPYYGHYYHYPRYRRHSVSVSYRKTIWRPGRHSGARQRHAASVTKVNRRLGATAASRKRYRTHSNPRLRKSVPHTAKRVNRPSTATDGQNRPASRTHRMTKPQKHSTRSSRTIMRRSETITKRGKTTRARKTTRTRKAVSKTAPAKRRATRASRTRTPAMHKSRDVRSKRPSSSRSRRSTVSKQRRQPSAVFKQRTPRARTRGRI
jgi:hypothetical protein